MSKAIFINVTSEGALLGEEVLNQEQAFQSFFAFRSNKTVFQTKATGIDTVKYYKAGENGQREEVVEPALVIEYGPYLGFVPLSESGYNSENALVRALDSHIAVVPESYYPSNEREAFVFSRSKAITIMRKANADKLEKDTIWTGVVRRKAPLGYLLNVGGFIAWMRNSDADWDRGNADGLKEGDVVSVKILERTKRKFLVSRKEALENPFDVRKGLYNLGSKHLVEVMSTYNSFVYARLSDGIGVSIRQGNSREVVRVGQKVLVQLIGVDDRHKLLVGRFDHVVA